ncbi:MAG: hypothetical protein CM15mP79_1100 [Methanobacteriota archaeon]|nr:MAG: hypothetical protein CM15mP79_1100 [Euryarchaeota archaeon]
MMRSFWTTATSVMPWFASLLVLPARPPSKMERLLPAMDLARSSTVAADVPCCLSAAP